MRQPDVHRLVALREVEERRNVPGGGTSAHSDLAYVISAAGRIRQVLSDDPGPGTATTRSSFASLLAGSVLRVMG